MHYPVLFKRYSIAVLLCGLLTVTRAIDSSRETIINGQYRSNDASSSQYRQQRQQPSPSSSDQPQQSKTGNGGHNMESNIPRNSYTMLSQAMSQAVSHEFSKWLFIFTLSMLRRLFVCKTNAFRIFIHYDSFRYFLVVST